MTKFTRLLYSTTSLGVSLALAAPAAAQTSVGPVTTQSAGA